MAFAGWIVKRFLRLYCKAALPCCAWSTFSSITAVDYRKSLSLKWTGLTKGQSPHIYNGLSARFPFSLFASLPPSRSLLHSLIACFIKMNWNAHAAGFVILQYHCKFNTQFSFKPKWHLTHPSNKSKQFKHRGDGRGTRGGRRGFQICSTLRQITRRFKLLVL